MTLDTVSGRLSSNFGESIQVVSLSGISEGQNRDRHFRAETGDGRIFGLKVAVGGTEFEEIVAKIAAAVEAPNYSRCVLDTGWDIDVPPALFREHVAKVEWLRGDCYNLRSESAMESIRKNLDSFFNQYGEWSALGLLLRVRDRQNPGNWVWDSQQGRLAMVDFEYSFAAVRDYSEYPRFLFQLGLATRELWVEDPEGYPHGFRNGFFQMRDKIRRRIQAVLALLENRVSVADQEDVEAHSSRRDDEVYSQLIETV